MSSLCYMMNSTGSVVSEILTDRLYFMTTSPDTLYRGYVFNCSINIDKKEAIYNYLEFALNFRNDTSSWLK